MNNNILELMGIIFSSTVVSVFVVNILIKYWVKARLEQSIKHEYDKELEEYRFEMRKREQAAMIAELFSQWVIIKQKNDETRFRELNRLSFEMSLWLPDEIAVEINKRLKNLDTAKPAEALLLDCREIIQGEKSKLRPEDITFFGTT
jgi:hypothetical protein